MPSSRRNASSSQDRLLQVAFPVSLGQPEEVEKVRIAEHEVRRQPVLMPQGRKLDADDLLPVSCSPPVRS